MLESITGILFVASCVSTPARESSDKPNVLFIVADDLNTWVGCYGHPLVQTPNIDRLAERGVRFDRAYCQEPVCNPSRTSFLSGRRPGGRLEGVTWLPHHFRDQGYITMEIPKVAHSYGVTRTAIQWDAVVKGDAERAVGLIEEHLDEPFFLGVGFYHTHDANSARPFRDLYRPEDVEWANEPAGIADAVPAAALRNINVEQVSDDDRRRRIADYFASISTLDAEVGRLMEALDRLELWDRTIVVFTSDHGKHKGEHGGVWDKRTLFEASVRVPLIVAAPGIPGGAVSPRLVELVDLYPTLAELCGLPEPEGLEGTSFVPLLRDPQREWKSAAFSRAGVNGGRSVRTARYRYSEWSEGQAVLYDYESDPHELHNLIHDPRHRETVNELRTLLQAGWQSAAPTHR